MLKTHVLIILLLYFLAPSDHTGCHDHPVDEDDGKLRVCKVSPDLTV